MNTNELIAKLKELDPVGTMKVIVDQEQSFNVISDFDSENNITIYIDPINHLVNED